jgi:Cas7 group CRISPR-associated protein Csh2
LEDKEAPFFNGLSEKYAKNPEHYCILESRGRERQEIRKEILNGDFVKKYWDARVFGNTFLEAGANKGFIKTGVVQFGVGVSISPVSIIRQTNTSKAGVQDGKNAGMAPLAFRIVEHGVYCMPFFVNPNYAGKTGCEAEDIELLKLLIPKAYDLTRSAIRPDVRLRHAFYINHKKQLGNCPDYLLIEALTPKRIGDTTKPSTKWDDYEDKTALPDELRAKVEDCSDLMID